MTLRVEPSAVGCGALIRGVDLSHPQSPAEIEAIRQAWLEHLVIGICDQDLGISDIERFAAALGPDGDDPFFSHRLPAPCSMARSSRRLAAIRCSPTSTPPTTRFRKP